jgi:hypothetical protein
LRLNQLENHLKLLDSDNPKQNKHVLKVNEKQQMSTENEINLENLAQKVKTLSENFYILLGS